VKLRFEDSFLMNERLLLPPDDRPLAADYDALTRIVRTADDVYSLVQDGNQKLSQAGKSSEALKRFREAISKHPQDPRALVALANFYALQGRHDFSLKELRKVLQEDVENPDAWQVVDQIAESLRAQSDPAIAKELEDIYEMAPAGATTKNYLERTDCEDYGEDENDFIAVGESVIFDLIPSEKSRGWRATRVRFPSQKQDTW
jgi:tetratricopeptide (TPR) repeat protein